MPPVLYNVACKICRWERKGINFELAIRTISRHLNIEHRIGGSIGGKDILSFVKELRKIVPHLPSEDGVVSLLIEDAVIIYDRVSHSWTLITPFFEIGAGCKIREEERVEAKKAAEQIKEKRKALVESAWKRLKYRKKYHHYISKYYKNYDKKVCLGTLSHTLQNKEHADFMQLWYEYHSLRPFIDSLSSQELERLSKISKELKKLSVRPPTAKELLKMELENSPSSP